MLPHLKVKDIRFNEKKSTSIFVAVVISFHFCCAKNKEIDQTEQYNIYMSIGILSLLLSLVIPTCPAAHTQRSHEIEPPPRPYCCQRPRLRALHPVIPLALQKASDSLYSSSLYCR